MSKILKCKTNYYDRINNICHKTRVPFEHLTRKVLTRKQSYDENSGRYSTKSEFVTYDPISQLEKYKVSDFSISTLNALGVKLDESHLTYTKMHHVENANKQIDNIENSIKNNSTNN